MPIRHSQILTTMFFENPIIHPSVMFRRKVFDDIKYDTNFITSQDYDLWSKLIGKNIFSNINEYLLLYRVHNKQISKSRKNLQMGNANTVREKLLKEYLFLNSEDCTIFNDSLNLVNIDKLSIDKAFNVYKKIIKVSHNNSNLDERKLKKLASKYYDRLIYFYLKEKNIDLDFKYIFCKSNSFSRFFVLKMIYYFLKFIR